MPATIGLMDWWINGLGNKKALEADHWATPHPGPLPSEGAREKCRQIRGVLDGCRLETSEAPLACPRSARGSRGEGIVLFGVGYYKHSTPTEFRKDMPRLEIGSWLRAVRIWNNGRAGKTAK